MTVQDVVAVFSLIVATITLIYLVKYVRATETIADQSLNQSEAAFRPAVVVKSGGSVEAPPLLVNIGNGPAIELVWRVPDSVIQGVVPYLEQRQDEKIAQKAIDSLRAKVVEARMMPSGPLKRQPTDDELHPSVKCKYRSLSGRQYTSTSRYDYDLGQFITTFGS
jgi:hypothetical protein